MKVQLTTKSILELIIIGIKNERYQATLNLAQDCLDQLNKPKDRTINIILAEEDIKRITNYLDKGTENIDDILTEITTQASIIPLNGTKED